MATALQQLQLNQASLATRIDQIGFGRSQYITCFFGGGVWLADGAELLIIGTVTDAVAAEWNLSPMERGFVVTLVFVGIFMGNLVSGPLSDWQGRKPSILLSYLGVGICSLLSAASVSYGMLCLARTLVGFTFGLGQPAFQSLSGEVCPSKARMLMTGISFSLFTFGELFSASLIAYDDPQMEHLHWRWLLTVGSLPSFILLLCSTILLTESPFYCSAAGRHEEAVHVLKSIAKSNGTHLDSFDFQAGKPVSKQETFFASVQRHVSIILSPGLLLSTLVVIYSCFNLNVIFYGSLYAFPQILTEVDMSGTPAFQLAMGALLELPGLAFGIVICEIFPRKTAMKIFLLSMVCAALAFGCGISQGIPTLSSVGYYGIKFVPNLGFLAFYQYSVEIYPTEVRATGSALSLAGGRLGGMLSPLVFELIQARFGSVAFFYLIAGLCAMNYGLIDLMPYETARVQLSDVLLSEETTSKAEYGSLESAHAGIRKD